MDERPPSAAEARPQRPEIPAPDGDIADRKRGGRGHRADRRRLDIARSVTTAAVAVAAAAGAATLGIVAGLLTLAGWGLVVVGAILAIGMAAALRPRPANGWLLVPVLALALPATAVAISDVRVSLDGGRVVATPAAVAEIPSKGYRAGLGDLLVDLRNLRADDGDRIVVRAGSDLGRTLVALPQDQCFHLDVRWRTGSFRLPRVRERPTIRGFRPKRPLFRLGQQSPGNRKRFGTADGRIALFGRAYGIAEGHWVAPTQREQAPTLTLDLTSEGGSFVVRPYPDDVSPLNSTQWPIDQWPPPTYAPPDRAVYFTPGELRRRVGVVSSGSVTVDGNSQYAKRMRASFRRREAFARRWARRVTGGCNPKGVFR